MPMQEAQLMLALAKSAHSFYKSQEIMAIIDEIWKTLESVYKDIANAHFTSARSAFASAANSRSPEQEIRSAIGHMRDAYHIYQELAKKTKPKRYLLFFTEEIPALELEDQKRIGSCLFEIATIIVICYSHLREPGNAKTWKDQASSYIEDFLDAKTSHLSAEHVYWNINKDYVDTRTDRVFGGGSPVGGTSTFYNITYYEFNEVGQKYIEQQKEEIRKPLIELYKKLGFK